MKIIERLSHLICEELEGAQEYAERYVEKKANGDSKWASRFKSMSEDELAHAMNIHELAIEEIDKINQVYHPTQEMLDKWNDTHVEYVDKAAWIKQMLTM